MLSEESGYRSATDAEFAELIWGGLSQAGAEVSPHQGHKKLVNHVSRQTLHIPSKAVITASAITMSEQKLCTYICLCAQWVMSLAFLAT